MKKVLLFLFVILSFGCFAQKPKNADSGIKYVKATIDTPVTKKYVAAFDSLNRIAATSPNKDTLYLPDDSVGRSIMEIWVQHPLKKNPTIVFVKDEEVLVAMIRKQKFVPTPVKN